MIILDATTKKLQIVLAGAITTSQLDVVSTYVDVATTANVPTGFISAENDTASNSTTPVDIVAAPAASTQRQIKLISIENTDTAPATVTVRYNNNATIRKLVTITLAVGSTLQYSDGDGWRVITAAGLMLGGTSSTETIYRATATLTDAQIKTLPTTGVNVVTAPAAGYQPFLVRGIWVMDFSAAAYTNIDNDAFAFYETTTPTLASNFLANDATDGLNLMDDSFGTAADRLVQFGPFFYSTTPADQWGILPAPEVWAPALALRVKINNAAAGNLTGGNAANTMKVTTYYLLEAIP